MKNMKVSMKLIVSFLVVAIFAAAVGISGIIGMTQMDAMASDMYDNQTLPLQYISILNRELQRMRVEMREYIVAVASNDAARVESTFSIISDINKVMTENFNQFDKTIRRDDVRQLFNEARTLFDGSYQNFLQRSYEYAKAGDLDGCINLLGEATDDINTITNNLDQIMKIRISVASDTNDSTTALSRTLLILIVSVLIVAIAVAIFLAFYISGLISKPIILLTAFLKKAGTTGDISLSPEDVENIAKLGKVKDEIGQCIAGAAGFVGHVTKVAEALEVVSNNDLTAELALLSDKDVMGLSLHKMLDNLNGMFADIRNATEQVASGSKQISDGAQALAQGSTEQAATVEELSASTNEISQKTKENATMAGHAAELAGSIKLNAEKGSRQMDEMMAAVKEINQASQSISKVIKVIDDIAFQTNILALNAAVEAARAGQHGKGFAVVAEEVRNLAAKSADAAKDTGGLIANSMEKAELGARIADDTAASLAEIVSGINESNQIVTEIAKSSEEQSIGISQINEGIDQVTQVVQQNSATAEESAAASEELSGQSEMLEQLIAQFRLRDGNSSGMGSGYSAPPSRGRLPSSDSTSFALNGGSGKY